MITEIFFARGQEFKIEGPHLVSGEWGYWIVAGNFLIWCGLIKAEYRYEPTGLCNLWHFEGWTLKQVGDFINQRIAEEVAQYQTSTLCV